MNLTHVTLQKATTNNTSLRTAADCATQLSTSYHQVSCYDDLHSLQRAQKENVVVKFLLLFKPKSYLFISKCAVYRLTRYYNTHFTHRLLFTWNFFFYFYFFLENINMDWLSDAVLLNVFCNIQGVKNCDEDEKLAMSLPHDYEKLMPKMLESLSKGLKKVHYDRKVKQCKDNEKSLSLREQGNKAFLASQNDPVGLGKALELYTKSIAHAVPHSEEISFRFYLKFFIVTSFE